MLIINVHDVRKEIHFVRRNYRFQTNRATIAHWSKKSEQKSCHYDVANSRYHFCLWDSMKQICVFVDFQEIMASLNFRSKTRVQFPRIQQNNCHFSLKIVTFIQNFHSQSQNQLYALTNFPLWRLTKDCPQSAPAYIGLVARGRRSAKCDSLWQGGEWVSEWVVA